MKRILLLLAICLSFIANAQESKAFYGKLNYAFVPHNILQGAGYTVGYQWNTENPVSYRIETGMVTSFRERQVNATFGDIRYLDLYYNLAQMNLAIIPNWRFISTNHWDMSVGLGFSAAYQSKIFTTSHYEYKTSVTQDYWEDLIQVETDNGIHAGLLGELGLNYRLSGHWNVGLTAQYQLYYQGEPVLEMGLGAVYKF